MTNKILNLIKLLLILLTINKTSSNCCKKCCQCCQKKNKSNSGKKNNKRTQFTLQDKNSKKEDKQNKKILTNKDSKKEKEQDKKSKKTKQNENNNEPQPKKINLTHIPNIDPDYINDPETQNNANTFIDELTDDKLKGYMSRNTTNNKIYIYKMLSEYAETNKLNQKDFKLFNTNGQYGKKITNNDKTIYIKQDHEYHSFYIDLLKYLDLTDLEYKYTGPYWLLTEELKDMIPITLNNYNDWKDFKDNKIKEITNIVPLFVILSFIECTDVNLINHNNLYLQKKDNKLKMKILDIDIHEESLSKFSDIVHNGTTKDNKIREIIDIFKIKIDDDKIKQFLIILANFSTSDHSLGSADLWEFNDDFKDIDIDKNYEKQIKTILKKTEKRIVDYTKTYNLYPLDYIKSLNEILKTKKFDYNQFLTDFIDRTFDKIKDKEKNNICKTKDDYKKWLEKFISDAAHIYEQTKNMIEIYLFANEEIPGNRIKNITEEEKQATIDIFNKMLDWLIDYKNNIENNNDKYTKFKLCYDKVVAKIKQVKKMKMDVQFLFENKEINDKINKL